MYAFMISIGDWLEHSPVSDAMDNWPHLFTAVTMFHYFSFFLVIGTSVMVDLRLLGIAGRRRGLAEFAEQFFPWTWGALSLAISTGLLMFVPQANAVMDVGFFFIKLTGLALSIAAVALIQWKVRKWDRAPVPPASAKISGLVSLLLWIATLISALEIAQVGNL